MNYNTLEIDAFKEIGNIGSGNAATSLSTLLDTMVDLEITEINSISIQDCQSMVTTEGQGFSVIHELHGDLNGIFWFVMRDEDKQFLAECIAGDLNIATELVLEEVTNILGGNYLKALCDMLSLKIDLNPPILSEITSYLGSYENRINQEHILYIKNKLTINQQSVYCCINLILEPDSFQVTLQKLGVSN